MASTSFPLREGHIKKGGQNPPPGAYRPPPPFPSRPMKGPAPSLEPSTGRASEPQPRQDGSGRSDH